jgi:hypothetical protein
MNGLDGFAPVDSGTRILTTGACFADACGRIE